MRVIRLLSTLALKGAVRDLASRYETDSGTRIDADFAPTLALLDRLRAGEGADVVILTWEGLDELARLARGRSCPARVKAGALNLPARRSNLPP